MRRLQRHILTLILAATTTAAPAAGYFVRDGQVHDPEGQPIHIRGINHYGFNVDILQPQYLWSMGWKQQIAQIKDLGFNAIRLPFAPATLHVKTPVDKLSNIKASLNADLLGRTPLEVLDMWLAEANRQGLYILLDFHNISTRRDHPLWFIEEPTDLHLNWKRRRYSEQNWLDDLSFVAKRYAHLPYVFAIDLYNEPHDVVRWSKGDRKHPDPKYHWKRAAERAAAVVLAENPSLLVFVEGINGNWDGISRTDIPMNWGEDLQAQAYQPLAIPADKLVLSPHTYGPDVYQKSSFSKPDFPSNLAANWEILFGQFYPKHPVILGEWGGFYGPGPTGELDRQWQNALVDYLISKGIRDSFYWCYTPNSVGTGGILDNNLQVREDKMALLRRLWTAKPGKPDRIETINAMLATNDEGVPAPTLPPEPLPQAGGSADFVLLISALSFMRRWPKF